MYNFYRDTNDAVAVMQANEFGLIEMPTGAGKGVVFELDASKRLQSKTSTIVIVTHRILLSQQMCQRLVMQMLQQTANADYKRIGIHSGSDIQYEIDEANELKHNIALAAYPDKLCISVASLEEELADSLNRGVSNVVFVTYHSLWKFLQVAAKLNLEYVGYCDEIHVPAGDTQKWEVVESFVDNSTNAYAFSATVDKYRKRIENVFNKRIYHLSAQDAIAKGLICKPVWMIAEVTGSRTNNVAQGVTGAYVEFQLTNPQFEAKSIVNCKDTDELAAIAESAHIKKLHKKYPNLMVAEISSNRGHKINNGAEIGRLDWIKQVNEHHGHLLVLHIDICNTGIDIPEFNLPIWTYWATSETYVIQGNGRGSRLSRIDRPRLEKGQISSANRSSWNKPYNTICMLVFTDTLEEDMEDFVDFIIRSRSTGFEVSDLIIVKSKGNAPTDPFEPVGNGSASKQDIQAQVNISLENSALIEVKAKARMAPTSEIITSLAF